MHIKKQNPNMERGNALLYVLISIALFAALGFTIARQMGNNTSKELNDAKAKFYATQIMTHAAQVQSAIEQMMITGSAITEIDLTLPSESGFNTAPHIHKAFHPQGGGIIIPTIREEALNDVIGSLAPGWYLGLFNNIEWTDSTNTDMLLTAYKIAQPVCEAINEKITGSTMIPALSGSMSQALTDDTPNIDLDTSLCPSCEGYSALCVTNTAGNSYSYYSVVAAR